MVGSLYALGANRWAGGAIDPHGYWYIERFRLEGTTPVWTFACADALLEKRIWMEHGANTTYVQYTLVRASRPMRLSAKVLVNYRGYHSLTHAPEVYMDVQPVDGGLRVQAFAEATPFYLRSAGFKAEPAHTWYRNYELAVETWRGLDHQEDHLHAGTFHCELKDGESVTPSPARRLTPAWMARPQFKLDGLANKHWWNRPRSRIPRWRMGRRGLSS